VVQSSWPVASGALVGWSGAEAGVDGKRKSKRTDAKHRHFQRMRVCGL